MIEPATRSRLLDIVGERHLHEDLTTRRVLSSDYSWISPILRRELDGMLADVVVAPETARDTARVLDVAYHAGVPVTARGKGTGNYGQAVPLAGGIVLDTSRFAEVLDVSDGWVVAEAGVSFARLEVDARHSGQELAMFPSTTRSSLGGFLCGGAGGTGSIAHGFIWDDFVAALEVVPCLAGTAPVAVEGAATVAPFLHAYGTTGLITAATVKLAPAHEWTALFSSFASWEDSLGAAWDLITRDPLPRNLAVDEAALVGLLPDDPAMPVGRVSLRAIVDRGDAIDAGRIIHRCGGWVEAIRPDATPQLVSLSYNHVTLRAVRARPELCHLQVGGPALAMHAEEVRGCLPGAMLHVDCHRRGGQPWFGGLLLSVFQDDETLANGITALQQLGVEVVNPHTYRLADYGLLEAVRAQASAFDPKGLLNPGKLPDT